MPMTEDQIDELKELAKALRAEAKVFEDAWDSWSGFHDDVEASARRYNELVRRAVAVLEDDLGLHDLLELEEEYLPDQPQPDEADKLDLIIEEDGEPLPEG